MLLVLISGFALSQAFRTAAAIMAPPLQQAFGLTPQQLGLFAGAFHFAFGGLQLFMGMGIDVYGVRRTVLAVFPLTVAGALVTAYADSYAGLLFGQALTGVGCAPAFLVCTVFIARRFPSERYASVNGAALGIGSVGLLLTGTPLAWVIQAWGWRSGYVALAACAVLAWLAILVFVREDAPVHTERPNVLAALRGYGELFRLPQTAGIIGLSLFTYASFLSLRGLWLGPLLIDRYQFTLVGSGNVAVAISVLGMVGPPLFGRLDPGDAQKRRRWIARYTIGCAALFAAMAFALPASLEVALALGVGIVSGYMVMQYADVRATYPARMTGRAMAVFTMAMFLGVALMQWLTGLAASAAAVLHVETYTAVFAAIAFFLVLGTCLYRFLPGPRTAGAEPSQS
ncbi:MFS transporter [Ramlibacter sp. USB13]|uniref:MFS transporter n=1 Tax=Ramlibacter cellulosilyticus TaxID=2764187 RepID=A0A923MNS2_9BURK|nr:MFS transporter [Ramlibacter cellulosilyticus]MBC5782735.1 MFS transporter [Ramlibacter cellulosilyticus]